ncbi:DNA cytosine methyltransferase [Aquirhabdus parva]|uniref:DNA (cytosine-5-)-methyltransferase n=1 Tax=Aquirhabdus parva TaxID=2283318 RepID=A0A345PAP9_9GAMM|nr:DNA cytosine methyltransferase [Aquirhabdus parva]AXI04358.1 DNA cytosine methyltransferase [Aquirhabdus parva]AXI04402.1 DNA cytosine methyltransferase [Aquirhabdus parva]
MNSHISVSQTTIDYLRQYCAFGEPDFYGLFPHELIVDNFAGGGGVAEGLEEAFKRPVDIAINHDPKALAMHRINHPMTKHYCESVWDVDPCEITKNQPVGLVWLSPDCKHFSKAKGGTPVDKKIRGLAWVALRWAAKVRPRVIMLENVEEFKTWGDVGKDGRPCPKSKGRTFNSFVNALRRQGYDVEYRVLRAHDFGMPTLRKRFFLVARKDGLPIKWPKPTHGDPASDAVKKGKLLPWDIVADCIDWSIPCPSIFERTKPLADATCKRIATGLMRYVVNADKPFIVKCNHTSPQYSAFRGQSIFEPLQTISSKNGYGIVAPVLTECANASSPRCMPANEPIRTICAQTKGGHHALVAAFLTKNYTGVVGCPVTGPAHTITAKDHHSLVTSHLVKLRNNNVGQSVETPLHTITAGGGHFAEVRAFLTTFYGNDKDGQSLDKPIRTIPTHDRFGLVMVDGMPYQIDDIGFRMLQPRELFTAQGFRRSYIIDRGIDEHGKVIRLTKTEQTRMCGNSVPPGLPKALVLANFGHEIAWRESA